MREVSSSYTLIRFGYQIHSLPNSALKLCMEIDLKDKFNSINNGNRSIFEYLTLFSLFSFYRHVSKIGLFNFDSRIQDDILEIVWTVIRFLCKVTSLENLLLDFHTKMKKNYQNKI